MEWIPTFDRVASADAGMRWLAARSLESFSNADLSIAKLVQLPDFEQSSRMA
jgi:hypothetical protein